MKLIIGIAIIAAVFWHVPARADEAVAQEMKKDVVLRALVDELDRSMAGLKLEDFERPYFIEYGLRDMTAAYVSADLGAVTGRNQNRGRSLQTDVRVGSYQLDNSNFGGGGYGGDFDSDFGGSFGAAVPIEDDYNAIRQAIWWVTDRDYKGVVEQLVQKKAVMESKLIVDKPDDFSRESPTVYFEDRVGTELDLAPLEKLAVTLSGVFRDYPDVQSSGASVSASGGNKYVVNTEGTRLRVSGLRFAVSVSATVQAEDGMKLSDSFSVYGRKFEELGASDKLVQRCRKMAERLVALKDAPTLESYTGPVLFDAEPTTVVFSRQFGSSFGGGQRPVGSRTSADDFANKLEKRILPRFLHVVDDPAQEEIAEMPVMGHYVYDDQAVKAQAVTLVEGGRLKALLMSRNPSKEFKQSNGHGRGYGGARAAIGCLVVTVDSAMGSDALKQELLDACADEGLQFGIRIAALGNIGGGGYGGRYGGFEYGGGAISPLVMYKVFPDGHEELVRGAETAGINLKAFKRMLAAGDAPYVYNTGGGQDGGQTVVAPAMLFEELDLAKVDRDFDKPPILPTPLARKPG